jgi:predicted nucleotidyltransferase
MSGNFVQRAEPAIADMRLRAEAALRCGADAVIELPALYATACGEKFADGAVNILNSVDGVSHLAFGAENADIKRLDAVAERQINETAEFKQALSCGLKSGLSYPSALTRASKSVLDIDAPSEPNDILAVEYLKRLKKTNSEMLPIAVKRKGSGYHDKAVSGGFSSAGALRRAFYSGEYAPASMSMPEKAFGLLLNDRYGYQEAQERFGLLVLNALREKDLSLCPDGGEGLFKKLKKNALVFTDLETVLASVKSKRYTASRIRRLALQALLCVTYYPFLDDFSIPCKLIGIKEDFKKDFLNKIKNNVLVKNTDFARYLLSLNNERRQDAGYIYELNRRASTLYGLIRKTDGDPYLKKPLLVV